MLMRSLLAILALVGACTQVVGQVAPANRPAAEPAPDVAAQDLLNPSPRGLVSVPAAPLSRSASAPAASASARQAGPLPADPALAPKPLLFGSQLFSGRFASETFSGFNPEYTVAVGDRISVRMWGAFNLEVVQAVDAQGNIFIANVGPVRVLGVRNADLNPLVESQVKRTFRASVGVYATLEAAQPVKVYVTGFVRAPGLYGGVSSDSVLYFLDRAGGIDPDRGSYLRVDVLRAGQQRARIDLYRFLLEGKIEPLQLQDGDTIVAAPRGHTVQIGGEVLNPFVFEFSDAEIGADRLLAIARPRPAATHMSIVRKFGAERRSEYHPLSTASGVRIRDGDEVTLTSDKYPGTILVHIDGAHLGERTLVLPYGAQLKDALARVKPSAQARVAAVQLYRRSVADRQKELLEVSLRNLETYALTARSSTSEEAALRGREAQRIVEFIDRARGVQPRGQVTLGRAVAAGETLLEDGDVIRVPETSNLVIVSGEVLFPSALVFDRETGYEGYIAKAGGFTQGADQTRVVVVRQDGTIGEADKTDMQPGDELMVLAKIETKNVEVARAITQIVYQTAVAARIALGL
jgi:protein involved in polysaccharide export with SLBB domain